MFFARGEKVMDLVDRHLVSVRGSLVAFDEFLALALTDELTEEVIAKGKVVEELESQADADRHEIIRSLLKGALLPDTRREVLRLVELVDEVANQSEEVMKQIILQKISFPKDTRSYVREMSSKTVEQFGILEKAISGLFKKLQSEDENLALLTEIEEMESEVDDQEYKALELIFNSDMTLAEKNQMSKCISKIADISDVIEDISDTIEIILAIRKA